MAVDIIKAIIAAAALEVNVDPSLAYAVAKIESNCNPAAVSSAGARGLFQLMPAVGNRYGLQTTDDFHDPMKNARAGCAMLSDLHKRYGTWWKALAAFVWGPGRVERNPNHLTWPQPVKDYVARVYGAWGKKARFRSPGVIAGRGVQAY